MSGRSLLEQFDIEVVAVPKDTTTTAIAGDFISMKNAKQMLLVIQQGAWETANAPAVTLVQALAAAGTTPIALGMDEMWSKLTLSNETFTRADVSNDTFDLTDVDNTMTAIEIAAEDLDRDNKYTHVQLAVADAGGTDPCLSCAFVILGGLRNQGYPPTILDDPKQ
jgi:hypothetical protein